MAVDPVTPIPGINTSIAVGGTAVIAIGPSPNGGFITNPATDADQGVPAETLYVDAVGNAQIGAFGTTFALAPGETWQVIPGQVSNTTVNAASPGHRFSVVSY